MPRVTNIPDRCLRDTCGIPLVPQARRGERVVVPPGHRLHAGRGLCRSCHDWASQDPERLERYPRLTRDAAALLAQWAELKADGHTYVSGAPLLGLSAQALRLVVDRARRRQRQSRTPGRTGWARSGLFDPDTRDEGEETSG